MLLNGDKSVFELAVIAVILANCILLTFQKPLPAGDGRSLDKLVNRIDQGFLCAYVLEAGLKIVALGFFLHKGAYLRSSSNLFDFLLILSELVNSEKQVGFFRAFRVLRPLRLVSGLHSLRVVLRALMAALVPLFNIAILAMFVILIYAIIGLQLYKSKLHSTCYQNVTDVHGHQVFVMMEDPQPCSNESDLFQCDEGYHCFDLTNSEYQRWAGPNHGFVNFDNIINSFMTVFVCVTMEGWSDVAYFVIQATGSYWNWLYFISLVVLGSFLVMNLVLGVLSGEFSKQKARSDRKAQFHKERRERIERSAFFHYREWIRQGEYLADTMSEDEDEVEDDDASSSELDPADQLSAEKRAPARRRRFAIHDHSVKRSFKVKATKLWRRVKTWNRILRRICLAFIESRECFIFVLALVFMNTVVLATEHYRQPEWLDKFQDLVNEFFVCVFTLEMLVKLWAMGPTRYFERLFNRFDCVIVLLSIIELVAVRCRWMTTVGLSVWRCTRLLRILKLTSYWSSLRGLVLRLWRSVRSIAGVILLLALFVFIAALLGILLFGGRFNFLDRDKPVANFDEASTAMMTVFQVLTGEDWNVVMYDGLDSQSKWYLRGLAGVFFFALFVVGNYILLNVFLAIAVDNLNEDEDDEEPESDSHQDESASDLDDELP